MATLGWQKLLETKQVFSPVLESLSTMVQFGALSATSRLSLKNHTVTGSNTKLRSTGYSVQRNIDLRISLRDLRQNTGKPRSAPNTGVVHM